MGSKRKQARTSSLKGFAVAFQGIWTLICNERNFRFHLLTSIIVIAACFFFNVEKTEWLIIFLTIGLVLSMEALNTSIEYICDLICQEHNPIIKKIKDVGAAAVLLVSIIAVIIGCIIFIPYLLDFFNS
jgi:diacylglycerol kinase